MKKFICLLKSIPAAAFLAAASPLLASGAANLPDGFPVTEGLSVFLDAESVATNGDQVMGMLDRTGNENHAWEVVDPRPRMPFVVENATPSGFNAVRFDGIGGYAEVASNPEDFDGRAKTVFLVFSADETDASSYDAAGKLMNNAYNVIDSWEPPEAQPHARYRTSDIWIQAASFRTSVRNPIGAFLTTQTPQGSVEGNDYFIGVKEWKESGDFFARVRNASNETFSSDAIGGMAEPEGHLYTRIGAGGGLHRNTRPEAFFGGEIAAVLIYNRELSAIEREQVESYLHNEYLTNDLGPQDPGNPPVLEGLILHLNGMNVVTEGETVTKFIDMSGRNNHALAYVHDPEPSLPVLVSNSTPSGADAVRFDGVGGYAEISSNPTDFDGRSKTTIAVFRPEHLSSVEVIASTAYEIIDPALSLGEQPGGRTRLHWFEAFENNGAGLRVSQRNLSGGFVSATTEKGSVRAGEFFIGINQWREDGDVASIVVDSGNRRFQGLSSGADAQPEGHIGTRLAATSDVTPQRFFEGEIASFLVYNRELSASELEQVEEFLFNTYFTSGPETSEDPPVTDGLVLHLNGANVVTGDGNSVTELTDISGRNNHAPTFVYEVPREGGPTLVAGGTPTGLPTVSFDGIQQYLEIASNPDDFDGRAKTTITIFKADEVDEGRLITTAYGELSPGESPAGRTRTNEIFTWGNGQRLRVNNRSATGGFIYADSPVESLSTDMFYIGVNQWRNNGETAVIMINEANERFEDVVDGADAEPTGHIHTRIGAGSGSGNTTPQWFFPGEIAAVLVYNRQLSDEELGNLEAFLHQRYIRAAAGTGFAEWIIGFGVPENLRGPEDDASGDGVPNLIKYAIGGDPGAASLSGMPESFIETVKGGSFLVMTIDKNPNAVGIDYIIEASQDLVNWDADAQGLVITEGSNQIEARIPVSQGEPRAFLRLRVVLD